MNLKKILASIAPTIAGALGGPMAGAITKKVAGAVLGTEDAKDDEIAAAIATGSPDLIQKVIELDNQFKLQLAELGVRVDELDVQDRINARAREITLKDHVPSILAFGTLGTVAVFDVVLLFIPIPKENRDVVFAIAGMLTGGALGQVLGYYFGSSRGSRDKDETIKRAMSNGS